MKIKLVGFLLLVCFGVATAESLATTNQSQTKKPAQLKNVRSSKVNLISTQEQTALEERAVQEDQVEDNPYSLLLYQPSYILPFYYTGSPDYAVYKGQTPQDQKVMHQELKAQLSIKVPILSKLFSDKNSLDLAYTQLSYWQVYANSQYFRETNYSPEIFFERIENPTLAWKLGAIHQSNGRGGEYERSWNRLYGSIIFSGDKWVVNIQPWMLIFPSDSSSLHNPDIEHYLGHGQTVFSYKLGATTASVKVQNYIESRFARGTTEVDWSFPLHGHFRGYVQVFSGYGQSLIEYNHFTNSAGVGIAFNDWI